MQLPECMRQREDTTECSLDLHFGLAGDTQALKRSGKLRGADLAQEVAMRPNMVRPGTTFSLVLDTDSGPSELEPQQTLWQQGCGAGGTQATIWAVRKPILAAEAWRAFSSGRVATLGLSTLHFGEDCDFEPCSLQLPSTLEQLTCPGPVWNMSQLQNLRSLTLDANHSLKDFTWPRQLEMLTLGPKYNQDLRGAALPESLMCLFIGDGFNQTLDGIRFPARLKELSVGRRFNQTLDRVELPDGLEVLHLGYDFDQDLSRAMLPRFLKALWLGGRFNRSLDQVDLPPELQELVLGHRFNRSLENAQLPPTLKKLGFGNLYGERLEKLSLAPGVLQILVCGTGPSQQFVPGKPLLPCCTALIEVHLGDATNNNLQGVEWPPGLLHLDLGDCYNRELFDVELPTTLRTLTFGKKFNQPFASLGAAVHFPENLRRLVLGSYFNQRLQGVQWPQGLQELVLGAGIQHASCSHHVPSRVVAGALFLQETVSTSA